MRVITGAAFETFTQSAHSVSGTIRELATDTCRTIHARYLVGADGARSRVREVMGAKMTGDHAFALNYNLIVRIPELEQNPPDRRAIMYWTVNPESPGVLSPLDGRGVWAFGILLPPGVKEIADRELVDRLHTAIGRPMQVEILERDLWAAHRLIADRYRDRSVFLAGDACHLHPPYGGFGMNLGIADGVDLGWKLAGTLQGWGGDLLLASYEEERRAIHQRTIAAAIENYRTLSDHLVRDGLNEDTTEGERARAEVRSAIVAAKTREFKSLGVVLGSYYENSPIIVAEGTAPPPVQHEEFQPCARPGCLAPHAWLDDGSSLYDHFGLGLSLLLLTDSGLSTARAIAKAAEDAHVPLKVLDLRSVSIAQLYEAPLALIRPDQYVAWRGADINPAALLDTVRGAETKTTTRRTAPWERLTPTPSTSTA